MKNRDKKARTTLESHYARRNGRGKTPHIKKNGTMFKRWQKWPFCKGYIPKQNGHKWSILGREPQNTKNIEKLPITFI